MPRRPMLIAFGGALGVLLRWGILDLVSNRAWLTVLGLNIAGSALIGLLAAFGPTDRPVWSFAALGFCGGLTTFSTFALDVAQYLDTGQLSSALGLVTGTVALATMAAGVGYRIGQRSAKGRRPGPWQGLTQENQPGWRGQ